MTTRVGKCECSDTGCPVEHEGFCMRRATTTVRRIDLDDGRQRFRMCRECANDALASGVFA